MYKGRLKNKKKKTKHAGLNSSTSELYLVLTMLDTFSGGLSYIPMLILA
jgi:hypothetical protein